MWYEKNIHWQGKDGVKLQLQYEKFGNDKDDTQDEWLKTIIDGELISNTNFPNILLPAGRTDMFWDLVREDIVAVGKGKSGVYIKCRVLNVIQKQLK